MLIIKGNTGLSTQEMVSVEGKFYVEVH